jgi:lipopolysaccharide export system permease protein
LLAFLAVPLSRSQPRAGRYGRIALGLLVFIIYFNLLNAAKAWVEQGSLAPAVGLWWVHAAVLLLTLALLSAQNGWHRRLLR